MQKKKKKTNLTFKCVLLSKMCHSHLRVVVYPLQDAVLHQSHGKMLDQKKTKRKKRGDRPKQGTAAVPSLGVKDATF